jgi:hypothetical protein
MKRPDELAPDRAVAEDSEEERLPFWCPGPCQDEFDLPERRIPRAGTPPCPVCATPLSPL